MILESVRSMIAAGLLLAVASPSHGEGTRISSFERYGIGGYIQVVGIHHGFHIESVLPDSDAARDLLKPHDVIVKVDGDVIRGLDHLRAVLAEAYLNDAEVSITYTRGTSLMHHVVKSQTKLEKPKAVARKRRSDVEEDR